MLRVDAAAFRTAWFLESVLSELLILLVIRTRRPLFRSRPGKVLLWTSIGVAAFTVLLPFMPVAGPLGFAAMPASLALVVLAIVAAYVLASEVSKRMLWGRVSL
jgi:Mg2+-importing ATPase